MVYIYFYKDQQIPVISHIEKGKIFLFKSNY